MGGDHTAWYSFGILLLLCSPQARCLFTWRISPLGHTARYSLLGLPLLLCAARGCVFLVGHTARYSFGVLLLLCSPQARSPQGISLCVFSLLTTFLGLCVSLKIGFRHQGTQSPAGILVCTALALLLVTRHTSAAGCMPSGHTRLIPDRHVPVARRVPPLDEGPALISPASSVSDSGAAQSSLASLAPSAPMATSAMAASPSWAPIAPSAVAQGAMGST